VLSAILFELEFPAAFSQTSFFDITSKEFRLATEARRFGAPLFNLSLFLFIERRDDDDDNYDDDDGDDDDDDDVARTETRRMFGIVGGR